MIRPLAIPLLLAVALVLLQAPVGASSDRALPASPAHSVGLFDPGTGTWYLRDAGGRTTSFAFGGEDEIPLSGDWDGDGFDSPALYRPVDGRLSVRYGSEPITFLYGLPAGGMPVAADTDGDGKDTVSLGRAGKLYVIDGLAAGPARLETDPIPLALPPGTDQLTAGDFDGDGRDEIAAVHDGIVETITEPGVGLGVGRALVVAGDWDGDGVETPAAFSPWRAEFTVYHGSSGSPWRSFVHYGATGMLPVAGRFEALTGEDQAPPRRVGLPRLAEGDEGAEVRLLQAELAKIGLYRSPIDGVFGRETKYAVVTFHKVLGLERTWEWEEADSANMVRYELPGLPVRPDEPDRVEVDIGRQVLYIYRNHEVQDVIPVSTGGSYSYYSVRQGARVAAGTPRGDYTLFHHSDGWVCDPLTGWCIYRPWSFTPYYAVHGYNSVPEYPASHGCVRVPNWDADYMATALFLGMPIHLWDEAPLDGPA